MFRIETHNGSITRIWDTRYSESVDITDGTGRFGYLAYTRKDEDINAQEKPGCIPFLEKHVGYAQDFYNAEFKTKLSIESTDRGLVLDMRCDASFVDGAGLFLPFNFISRKNGTWQQQFTVSSPYHTSDGRHHMFYLARPDGNGIVCVVENEIDCYQINYSPYLSGHFIRGITFWSQIDKAYGRALRPQKRVRVHILSASDYWQAIRHASEIWRCPALYYVRSSCRLGEEFRFSTLGDWEFIRIESPTGQITDINTECFVPNTYGFYRATPYLNGRPGMDCTLFAHDAMDQMHKRSTFSIVQDSSDLIGSSLDGVPIYRPPFLEYRGYADYNLCEHCMWAWSALKYLLRTGWDRRLCKDIRNLINILLPENEVRLKRCSYDAGSGYHTFDDHRIQEAYNGVNILLDSYRLFRDERLLSLAKTVLRSRLAADMHSDGGLYRHGSDGATAEIADYTTVTCMVFPVVNMSLLLREKYDPEWEFFAHCAERIADHVVDRGLDFPTEGGSHPECNPEVEEGSMSCAALTVLYVFAKLHKKQEYLSFASTVFPLHDAYTSYTPHPCMFRSSLRWWETVWEGDTDGPAICFGHAWTIWRAEAEFWYGILTYDDARLTDSYNGFMTNFSKTDLDGNMYAIYQHEPLSSGAIKDKGWEMDRSNREGFPHRPDVTLSRYAWARADETWFDTVAILKDSTLMAHKEDGVIVPEIESFHKLYIGDVTGTFYVRAAHSFEVISRKRVSITGNGIIQVTVTDF